MKITADTKLIGLLGAPVAHSISPYMYNEVFKASGMNYCYLPIEVGTDHLKEVINGLKYINFSGFALTKPNKIEVMQYLDEVDELANIMGSCNTIVNNEGKLKGYNTDGDGFVMSLLRESHINLKDTAVFCFGAGGAARACCFTLAYRGVGRLYISSRSGISCKALADDINSRLSPVAEAVTADNSDFFLEKVAESDVLLNMTGLGMLPHQDETPIEKSALNPGQICYDATYNPPKTRFLKEAESVGCRIINGLGMLVNQGAMQFKLWTGKPEPYDIMESFARKAIYEVNTNEQGY